MVYDALGRFVDLDAQDHNRRGSLLASGRLEANAVVATILCDTGLKY